ncbi:hypothetical protein A3B57_04190 [Microgenomates group bacterium RIFCSPLOWO2_01_FULL_47_10]|nr:MAG: hypothetical protein A3B57_04190 [Microgenomates group bacterium RIFCSPLOWO2_01_FULL_47_10]
MKRLRSSYLFVLSFVSFLWLPTRVLAQWSTECVGGPDGDVATIGGIGCLVENLLGNALRLIGLVAFVFIAIGAFRWLSSGGDAKAVDGAKQTITMAILGLTIAAGAWFIFALIQSITGMDLANFSVTLPN